MNVNRTMYPAEYVAQLQQAFTRLADAERAVGMRAYMRDQFDFLGIQAPVRKDLQRQFDSSVTELDQAFDIAERLWELEEREYQYAACDLLERMAQRKMVPVFQPQTLIERTQQLVLSKSWWDTVDSLAPNVAGAIILRSSSVEVSDIARDWIAHTNFWVQRSALLLQLKYKKATNVDLLFELVLATAHSSEFFLRKGAGWVLREYSKTNPAAVRTFLNEHADQLSALTVREGGKYC